MAKKSKQARFQSTLSTLLYVALIATIVLYAVYGNPLIGIVALALIFIILYYEVKYSIQSEGTKKSIIDIASAIGAAIVVWIVLVLVLQTSSPINAVSSCSMLPALHRGDLVLLHGIGNVSQFAASKRVPVINVNQSAFQNMESNISNEFLAYYAYFNNNRSRIAFAFPNGTSYAVGLYNTYCINAAKQTQVSQCFVPLQNQNSNLIRYAGATGRILINSTIWNLVYTSQIGVGNTSVYANLTNPIIVYQTNSKDYFSGSIIHRLFAILNVSGRYYFLTKGDNNQALDIQFQNYPPSQSDVVGYVIGDVPIVGYVKLLLSGQLSVPAGCNQQILSH